MVHDTLVHATKIVRVFQGPLATAFLERQRDVRVGRDPNERDFLNVPVPSGTTRLEPDLMKWSVRYADGQFLALSRGAPLRTRHGKDLM